MFLSRRHTHQHPDLDIIVHTIYIGIGMVDHIVFHIPHKLACAQHTAGIRGDLVHQLALAETAVSAIVHYIKADGGYDTTEQGAFQQAPVPGRLADKEVQVQGKEADDQHNRFMPEGEIAGLLDIVVRKILLYTAFELAVQRVLRIGKFG